MLNGEHWHRTVVFGKTGSGKTVLSRNLVKDRKRVLYIDTKGYDYQDGVIIWGIEQLKEYWPRVFEGEFKIVFRSTSPRKEFPMVCKMAMACGDMTMLVDEMDVYFKKGEPSEEFADVIRRGRGESIEIIGVTQRPRQMGEVRSMAQKAAIFNTHEPSDLQYFKQSFGDELIEQIKSLQGYQYVWLNIDTGDTEIRMEQIPNDRITNKISSNTSAVVQGGGELDRPENACGSLGLQSENSSESSEVKQV